MGMSTHNLCFNGEIGKSGHICTILCDKSRALYAKLFMYACLYCICLQSMLTNQCTGAV